MTGTFVRSSTTTWMSTLRQAARDFTMPAKKGWPLSSWNRCKAVNWCPTCQKKPRQSLPVLHILRHSGLSVGVKPARSDLRAVWHEFHGDARGQCPYRVHGSSRRVGPRRGRNAPTCCDSYPGKNAGRLYRLRHCMPCPKNVDIPGIFATYNRRYVEGKSRAQFDYLLCTALRKNASAASNCVGCGKCERHCPQHIEIRKELKNAGKALKGPVYKLARKLIKLLKAFCLRKGKTKTPI